METQQLFGLDGLTALGARTGADMRPTLLRVLTDLYVHRLSHTPEEERHYTELALRLLEAVDMPTRVAVARRFAGYISPPLRVLQWLMRDLPEVRAQLRSHPLLQPSAPSERPAAQSAAAPVTDNATSAKTLTTMAPLNSTVAAELTELFFAANAIERRLILLNLNVVAPVSAWPHAVWCAIFRSANGWKPRRSAATGKASQATLRERCEFRASRQDASCVTIWASRSWSWQRRSSMPREVLYRVLLFVNPTVGHSVERVHALAALNDEMTQAAAEGMVVIWQALPTARNES